MEHLLRAPCPSDKSTVFTNYLKYTTQIICNTGVMASMAYESLTKLGYKARYLNAIVQIDKQGNYEFTAK